MSNIFKIFHIDEKNIKKVYVFNGGNEEEVFSKSEQSIIEENGIEVAIIDEVIYKDDTIRRIKEKIVLNCDMNVSISEI